MMNPNLKSLAQIVREHGVCLQPSLKHGGGTVIANNVGDLVKMDGTE